MASNTTNKNPYVAHNIHTVAKADTGASKHYFTPMDKSILQDIKLLPKSSSIHLPNNHTIHATETGQLAIHPSITSIASKVQVLPQLKNSSLISIGQLCDDGCVAIFDKRLLHIFKNNLLVLKGHRNLIDGLWDVPLKKFSMSQTNQPLQVLNVIIHKNKTHYQLANFYHGAMCSPSIRTLQLAIKITIYSHGHPSTKSTFRPTSLLES